MQLSIWLNFLGGGARRPTLAGKATWEVPVLTVVITVLCWWMFAAHILHGSALCSSNW